METIKVFDLIFVRQHEDSSFYDNKENNLYLIKFEDGVWEANSSEYNIGAIGNTPEKAFKNLTENLRALSKPFLQRIDKFENIINPCNSINIFM